MRPTTAPASPPLAGIVRFRPLLGEINDLKRVRAAGRPGSLAGRGFARAWAALVAGEEPGRVARLECASAVASARLGAIEPAVLIQAGLAPAEVLSILADAVDAASAGLGLLDEVCASLDELPGYLGLYDDSAAFPSWVGRLADQPRAGATRPGHARLVLEPAESHAEHCYVTGVYGVLVASVFGASPTEPFLAGLAHHIHNATLPDSGFAGEALLGDHLARIVGRFTAEALAELPDTLAGAVAEALSVLPHAETPEARAFHAADVLDRVLQMAQYARVAAFELGQALGDLDLVHPGPLQSFQIGVLAGAGLWS